MGKHAPRILLAASAAVAVITGSTTAGAQKLQEPRQRQGYYVALGAHGAVQSVRDEGDAVGTGGGLALGLRAGQLLTPHFGLGIQLDGGGGSLDGRSANMIGLGIVAQYEVANNFALHAGGGLGMVQLAETDEADARQSYNAAYTVGATYDWFLGSRRSGGWALTPGTRFRAAPGDPLTAFAFYFGVEISYWSGLSDNQLALSTREAWK
jgi:hypothetical protein